MWISTGTSGGFLGKSSSFVREENGLKVIEMGLFVSQLYPVAGFSIGCVTTSGTFPLDSVGARAQGSL
jgi:hypothetical protein